MNFVNAEITKISLNTFITTKIAYANMLGSLCSDIPGANVDAVTNALGADSRIGKKYLRAGSSYGGPCFPRDNRALSYVCDKYDVAAGIPKTTDKENSDLINDFAHDILKWHPTGVGILGLSYKPDTAVTEQSFGLLLGESICGNGFPVWGYDPNVSMAYVFERTMEQPVIIIAVLHPEFEKIPDSAWEGKIVFDPWRAYKRLDKVKGVRYNGFGIGRTE